MGRSEAVQTGGMQRAVGYVRQTEQFQAANLNSEWFYFFINLSSTVVDMIEGNER